MGSLMRALINYRLLARAEDTAQVPGWQRNAEQVFHPLLPPAIHLKLNNSQLLTLGLITVSELWGWETD